ncbi:amino acid ABC transporter permease [Virgisporangium ochraceum]|uniref:Amino acid ABC transporter permease n=1 Tax=Virgisporangium ochraceum TaxID=65505 RepID=A0A8J4EG26_9ACTN|nr:ABC transporter permease subunit [Virgisporangium ochraceum]GIJ70707.1 amino acid ABC transporter permease [Virgisporangium ochraceum]
MIVNLLIGLPDQRPGGLLLSVFSAVVAGGLALAVGIVYATACVAAPRVTLSVQGGLAILRGVPLLILVFALAQTTTLPLVASGFVALFLYSVSHVGEALRSYLAAYPPQLREQARLLGISPTREWLMFRIPWTLRRSLDALGTHWVSLLKDTGALTVLGIGELTTVARILSERTDTSGWLTVLLVAAAIYLVTIAVLTQTLSYLTIRFAKQAR